MARSQRTVALTLACIAIALLLVGIQSATLIRHVIQIAPALVALAATVRKPEWGAWPALPIYLAWLFVMSSIWLYLLGIARVVTGTFTPVEVVLTIVIGASEVLGLAAAVRTPCTASAAGRAVLFAIFAALQVGAVWYSLAGPYARE